MEKFIGKWEAYSAENQDALFDIYEIPAPLREHIKSAPTIHYIRREGELWYIKMEVGGRGREVTMRLGEEFEDTAPNGDTFKAVVHWADDKLIGTATFAEKNIVAEIERRMDGEEMVVEITARGHTTTQRFKKVE